VCYTATGIFRRQRSTQIADKRLRCTVERIKFNVIAHVVLYIHLCSPFLVEEQFNEQTDKDKLGHTDRRQQSYITVYKISKMCKINIKQTKMT